MPKIKKEQLREIKKERAGKSKVKPKEKKEHPTEKAALHPRNRHRARYNFKLLISTCPALIPFVQLNIYKDESIDFANPEAVKLLNTALLKQYYGIANWDIPEGYLCPPIPGRADYIHHISDVLAGHNFGKIPSGKNIRCLDIGVGANCVYPIIGTKEYGWSFVGTDIDEVAIASANRIIAANPLLKTNVECRLQANPKNIFLDIIQKDEFFDLTICNPPFHASAEAAEAASLRKLNNLNEEKVTEVTKNFGGQPVELWCEGGEEAFVREMIRQSRQFATSVFWFSTLIAKQSHLKNVYEALSKAGATDVKTVPMGQGNKTSRIVVWTFLTKDQQTAWRDLRWNAPTVVDDDAW